MILRTPSLCSFFATLALTTASLLSASLAAPAHAQDLGELIAKGAQKPADAVANLDVADGLVATLSASEPTIVSLTNLAVDYRGRVWVCEVMNYRHNRNKRPEGDRILILEDTTGDGVMDKTHVYYQGPDVDSAIGIGVFGNKVIVSCAPNVLVFTDTDGDDKPDTKEKLFTGIGGQQHDHSIHSFVFGPDGKFYFNMGNVGGQLTTPDGKIVVDKAGNEVRDIGKPYRQGMVFRCDEDGSNVETLAHNFRNNYEVAVDAFGTMWQSDNDDDGNRGVRINYVMEYGNYGYVDELNGQHWGHRRLNRNSDIQKRHWHQNDPGSIPNLLQTGAGSPTGMVIYEGDLLPKVFHGQMIHCDPGPSIVRAYPVESDGAGYKSRIVNLLDGTRDRWFRPVDVAVAPDGSLFVSDWYDPGVGGHRQDDTAHGRLFRVAPPGHSYKVEPVDFSDPKAAAEALVSCNEDTRYRAWHALFDLGKEGKRAAWAILKDSGRSDTHRARAMRWIGETLGYEEENEKQNKQNHFLHGKLRRLTMDHEDPILRIAYLRMARQGVPKDWNVGRARFFKSFASDPSPQVRREAALALRELKESDFKFSSAGDLDALLGDDTSDSTDDGATTNTPDAAEVWAKLAAQYDGKDRWYLEALGIGAHHNWDACLDAWMKLVGDNVSSPEGQDIVWRSRAKRTPLLISHFILNERVSPDTWTRWIRAMDFQADGPNKTKALELITAYVLDPNREPASKSYEAQLDHLLVEVARRIPDLDLADRPQIKQALLRHLGRNPRHPVSFDLIVHFQAKDLFDTLVTLAVESPNVGDAARPVATIVRLDLVDKLDAALADMAPEVAAKLVQAAGHLADPRSFDMLIAIAKDEERDANLRTAAARGLGRQHKGQRILLDMASKSELPEQLKFTVANILLTSWDGRIRTAAAKHLSLPETKSATPLPPLDQLRERRGDAALGKIVFAKAGTCIKCHKVGGEGTATEQGTGVGPDLSEIGNKLTREAMYVSILDPSAGVSHNYETYAVILESGLSATGILVNKTAESVTLKNSEGVVQSYPTSEIDELTKLPTSLMPADLQKNLTADDLVNLVEYLTTLKKK